MSEYMITVDKKNCTRCGVCLKEFEGFCMSSDDGFPIIDHRICNLCQKCVAICPRQALRVNNVKPQKIKSEPPVSAAALEELLAQRRSIKRFTDKPIPQKLLGRIAQAGRYAPNQQKNIDLIIVNDKAVLREIDKTALRFYHTWYNILFGLKPLTFFISLFTRELDVIKKKMERDLKKKKHIIKKGAQALIILKGNPRVSETKNSAHYLLASIIMYCETLRIGSCLMDSLRLVLNTARMRRKLRIPRKERVLGILCLGYAAEKIVNIPRGYNLNIQWNSWK
jgi:nitroreductase/NAD-dependent dihydropyrimidine dehydrogenase PreA subunit